MPGPRMPQKKICFKNNRKKKFKGPEHRYRYKIQPEFSRLLRFFSSAKINQSETVIPDIDQSPSIIFADEKKRSKRKNSGCKLYDITYIPLGGRLLFSSLV